MRRDPLLKYLRDRLAGAMGATELVEYLGHHAEDIEIRREARSLQQEFLADRKVADRLAHQLGGGSSAVKDASAWLREKFSRIKVGAVGGIAGGLAQLEAVEALALGILGKVALWDALIAAAEDDSSPPQVDYYALRRRAQKQYDRIELQRLRLAKRVLTTPPRATAALIPVTRTVPAPTQLAG